MALVTCRTGYGVRALARAGLACVRLRTRIAIITCGAVRLGWIGACTGRCVASAGGMALIADSARNRIRSFANTCLARIGLRTSIAVITGGPVGSGGVGTTAICCIARTCRMALITGDAHDWVRASAHSGLARIRLGAGIAVVTGGAIRNDCMGAGSIGIARVRGARVAIIAGRCCAAFATGGADASVEVDGCTAAGLDVRREHRPVDGRIVRQRYLRVRRIHIAAVSCTAGSHEVGTGNVNAAAFRCRSRTEDQGLG